MSGNSREEGYPLITVTDHGSFDVKIGGPRFPLIERLTFCEISMPTTEGMIVS
jgi:hypothetical protein